MEKMRMESVNLTKKNIDKIGELFPSCITESIDFEKSTIDKKVYKKAINFEILKQLLSEDILEGDEAYEFTWVGKKEAMVEANRPIRKTLRPDRESSVDWENTQNIYIEGDNLEALKLLQESYLGKVKMIYIDPPYNTGSDFVYRDNFTQDKENYDEELGINDEEGNRLFQNTESNGRFHSDWCSMIQSRLMLAKNLLSEDGVICISIGQAEINNLVSICDSIFNEANRLGIVSRLMKSGGNKGEYFSPNIDYVLVYGKNRNNIPYFREELSEETINTSYTNIETEGENKGERFAIKGLCQPGLDIRPNQRYWIECPDGSFVIPRGVNFPKEIKDGAKILPSGDDSVWKWTYDRYIIEKQNNNILFKPSSTATALVDQNGNIAKWNVFNKIWLKNRLESGRVPVDIITKFENRISSKELKLLNIPFDFAKPIGLISYLIKITTQTKDIIAMDFFSGSATTAHAVMQLNAEDGGNRKFIMVQLPEKTDEKSEAYKARYKNICEIGKERIRRAGKKIKEENPDKKIDIGFRVFKVDDTNMRDIYYTPTELKQGQLELLESNIKEDRTDEDLLYGCLLDWGVELSLPHKVEIIDDKRVHIVDEDALIACFEDQVPESVMRKIAEMKPTRVVFKDGSFSGDANKINVEEIFKLISPETTVKVI